ncbi:hypothetical protein CVT25_012551 [Psilocybe cyanescens]|uniref:Retrotransposon gag domain-containing protein n=1 Tax=Psilocybe cyanescens TaxID=93625 RepID=A0A409XK64_PSICY|nr:hypothetical protein CVT25_012551 [Psilocybe cyanescens]
MSSLGNFAELPMNVGMDPAQADSIPQPNLHHTGESSGSGSGALVPVSFPPIPSYLANLVQAPPLAPPVVAKSFGGTVKVHNPRMFNSKYEEVTPFLSEIHRIIEFNAVSFSTDHHKVLYVGLYLKDGIPIEWFNHLEQFKSPLLYDWSGFVQEFTTKFADPHLILSADQKLDRLKQTELSLHLDMTEQTKISHFMKGLKPAIKDNLDGNISLSRSTLIYTNVI